MLQWAVTGAPGKTAKEIFGENATVGVAGAEKDAEFGRILARFPKPILALGMPALPKL